MFIVSAISSFETSSYELMSALTPNIECYPALNQAWGIAFFEYMIQVPANRIGHQAMDVGQLKILQEVVTLTVFVPFSVLYLKEQIRTDYLWAGLCILGAVYFIFRRKLFGV
jgi:uncharacterized protein (DUF486 family)